MTDFQMQTDLAETLKRMQQENTEAGRIRIANEYEGKFHVHFKEKVREDMAMGKLSNMMNEAQKGNIWNMIDGMKSNDLQSAHAIQAAFGAGGAAGQNPMGQMMQGMQQAGQQGMQAAQQLPQALQGLKLDSLTKMPESIFKNIEQIVKSAEHGGGSHDASHDTDNDAHHKDHDVDHGGSKEHSKEERDKQVTVTSSEHPLKIQLNPQDTNAGSGSGSTFASSPASHDAAAPAAPISAGIVSGNDSGDLGSGDTLASDPETAGGLGDPDTATAATDAATAAHDAEESAVSGPRNYHNEAHW